MSEELLNTTISLLELKVSLVIKDGKADGLGFEGNIKDDLQAFLGGPGVQVLQDLLFRIRDYTCDQLKTQGTLISETIYQSKTI